MNEHHIKTLRIENFKSIKEMELECSRINVFVGKPNVGKSNILEAISLYGLGFNSSNSILSNTIRFDGLGDLFHFDNSVEPIKISSNIGNVKLLFIYNENRLYIFQSKSNDLEAIDQRNASDTLKEMINSPSKGLQNIKAFFTDKDGNMNLSNPNYANAYNYSVNKVAQLFCDVKKYQFNSLQEKNGVAYPNAFLIPPHGQNLISIIQNNKELRSKIGGFVKDYDLEFIIDTRNDTLGVQRKFEDGLSYILPYSLTADTFQRMIFHHAAILSNRDSIILFEEPESHSYPPYITELAEAIIDDENNNQYFLTTHSPFIFNKLMAKTKENELAAFIVYYENCETKLYRLTDDDMSNLLDHGADIFYNLNWFIND